MCDYGHTAPLQNEFLNKKNKSIKTKQINAKILKRKNKSFVIMCLT